MTVYLAPEKGEEENRSTQKYKEKSNQKNDHADECMEKELHQPRMK